MESVLGWLGSLMEHLISLFPHLAIVRCNEGGVRYRRGKNAQELKPGVYLYWPVLTEVHTYYARHQVVSTAEIPLSTKDRETVVCSVVAVYSIRNLLQYAVENLEADEGIGELLEACAQRLVRSHELAWLLEGDHEEELTKVTKEDLSRRFGIDLWRVRFSALARGYAVSLSQ